MTKEEALFQQESEKKAFDREHRARMNFSLGKYEGAFAQGAVQFDNLPLARERAAFIRKKVIENLDKYLLEWEGNFRKNGGKTLWAENSEEANTHILRILKKHGVTKVVKSKSMTTEEIGLNTSLRKEGIQSIETDLGEYIQQLAGEPPYHMVTPAMHKSREDIAKLFHEKLGTPLDLSAEQLAHTARERLRSEYLDAGAGITGANFLLADNGGLVIVENEGNARLTAAFPKIHIALVGLEKILPAMQDLNLFLPLLATHGTGQKMTAYTSILTGPRRRFELDGPEEMYVILLDNGRTDLLGVVPQREALACIHCGACLNVCPVFKNIGGHTYGKTYTGPIGSVITPFYEGFKEFGHLSDASTLCGKCTEVCPVNIDLHKLLLANRQKSHMLYPPQGKEKLAWQIWKKAVLNRSFFNNGSAGIKSIILGFLFGNSWGKRRAFPKMAAKSFNQQWKERKAI